MEHEIGMEYGLRPGKCRCMKTCHCGPVRTLVRQSVFSYLGNPDSHGSDIGHCLGMTLPSRRRRRRKREGPPTDRRAFCLSNQKYFLTPSGASSASSLMVMVNLILCASENLSSQSRKSSVSRSLSTLTILVRLSIKIWVIS